ncbi:L,D-transpeptidase family protein [Arcobacter roscoffensis]|uniref:L,D-transpeptidase family protein n=1 Tax=Arcobacter roscoffensis TaxID=2961520 RepID=A0ABY5E3Q4_9BACT|nr:L,D-transpeptidase family protein [Arcobacter roscoffensis]UTJ06796.1 L,D-transpeptidase family protein [Arcobacter roscoffensis]
MKINTYIFLITIIIAFTACSNKTVQNQYVINTDYKEDKKVQEIEEKVLKDKINILDTLSKKEKEFLEILKKDSYSSLCSQKDFYTKLEKLESKEEISKKLKEFFPIYVENLENSCINKEAFKSEIKKNKYKDLKYSYEFYTKKINTQNIIKEYEKHNVSIKSILDNHTPSHPDFFKFISFKNSSDLNKKQKARLNLNIERLKVLKDYKSNDFIQLNIPSYNFSLYENGKNVKSFGTVVGSKKNQTPILSSKLSYFIVNPTWNIPSSIAKKSIIPKALKDKKFLKKKNIVIREKRYDLDAKKVKFSEVKWDKYLKEDVKYIPYKFIQLPSKTNGMGRVKYMFKNDHAVYMHDTIGSWRFKIPKESIRAVSHGCIRLEHPISLMKHITKKYTPKTYKSVRYIYDNEKTDSISLSKKLPLHITYITSYIKDGKLKFTDDIYGYDKIQKLNYEI